MVLMAGDCRQAAVKLRTRTLLELIKVQNGRNADEQKAKMQNMEVRIDGCEQRRSGLGRFTFREAGKRDKMCQSEGSLEKVGNFKTGKATGRRFGGARLDQYRWTGGLQQRSPAFWEGVALYLGGGAMPSAATACLLELYGISAVFRWVFYPLTKKRTCI